MHKNSFKRFLFLGLTLIWMAVIFLFSAQQGEQSASLSSSLTYFLISLIYPEFNHIDMSRQLEILNILHFLIRKCAHMSEYAVLWGLSYQFFKTYSASKKRCFLMALMLSFVYACTDEFHQSFIPGRGPTFFDVMIDTSGALLFGLLYIGIEIIYKKRKSNS